MRACVSINRWEGESAILYCIENFNILTWFYFAPLSFVRLFFSLSNVFLLLLFNYCCIFNLFINKDTHAQNSTSPVFSWKKYRKQTTTSCIYGVPQIFSGKFNPRRQKNADQFPNILMRFKSLIPIFLMKHEILPFFSSSHFQKMSMRPNIFQTFCASDYNRKYWKFGQNYLYISG